MAEKNPYPPNVFVSLQDLLVMEHHAYGFSFKPKNQRVKSILGGRHASKMRGRGLDFEEVRNYVHGDDIRNIDWKVTARTQKTHTKVFTEEKEKPCLIVVDQSEFMFFGSAYKTKSVIAAELASLIAFRILKDGDRVGGIVMGNDGVDIVLPKRDRRNILYFLDHVVNRNQALKKKEPSKFEENLKTTMGKVRNVVTHDYLVIVISDFIRYSPKVPEFLARIAQHNDVILAKVYDPYEKDLPAQEIIMGDGKKQLALDAKKNVIRKDFAKGAAADQGAFEAQMAKYRIPVLKVSTEKDVQDQMKDAFKPGNK